jgi:hypothetical protein
MPLSAASLPRYVLGIALQAKDVMRKRLRRARTSRSRPISPFGQYLGGEWADSFFQRTKEKIRDAIQQGIARLGSVVFLGGTDAVPFIYFQF